MLRAHGAGIYSQAPEATAHANLHMSTYKLKPSCDQLADDALARFEPYLASAISAGKCTDGRENDGFRWCFRSYAVGMQRTYPVPIHKPVVEEEFEPPVLEMVKQGDVFSQTEIEIPAEEIPQVVHSKIPGVELLFDPGEDPGLGAIALKYLPQINERLFYITNMKRVKQAIKGRIVEPHVEMNLTPEERKQMETVVTSFVDYMKSDHKMIDRIATSMLFGDYKSKKWSEQRATKAIERLRQEYAPGYKFAGSIKLEPSKRGKPPRLIIADADRGQIMAWVLIGVFEKWLFLRYKKRSIKGLPKEEAMSRVVEQLNQRDPCGAPGVSESLLERVKCAILENDGSAWDACMSQELRDLTENKIMEAMAGMLDKYLICEGSPAFIEARLESNSLKKLRLRVHPHENRFGSQVDEDIADLPKGKDPFVIIRAIRRSGCRGTSVLNWIANQLCWIWVLAGDQGVTLVKPEGRKVLCVDGVVRFIRMVFEGDDSILSLFAKNGPNMTDELLELLTQRWAKLGHRPKLFWRKEGDIAEAVGWHYAVDSLGLVEETGSPDVMRVLTNSCYSTIKAAIAAAEVGDTKAFGLAVAPGILSRSYTLAKRFPGIALCLFQLASRFMSRDSVVEFTGDDRSRLDLDFGDVLSKEWEIESDAVFDERLCRATLSYETMFARTEKRINENLTLLHEDEPDLAVRLKIVPDFHSYYDLLDLLRVWSPGIEEQSWTASMASVLRGEGPMGD